MEALMYLLAIGVVLAIVIGGLWVSKKYKIEKEDYDFVLLLLGMVNYVTNKIEWKWSTPMVTVMEIVIDAVGIVRDTHDEKDVILLKQYILDEAEILCVEYGVEVDDEFKDMLSTAIDYIIQ